MNCTLSLKRKAQINSCLILNKRQILGRKAVSNPYLQSDIPERLQFHFRAILERTPSEEEINPILLAFSITGNRLLSYSHDNGEYCLQIWQFNFKDKLELEINELLFTYESFFMSSKVQLQIHQQDSNDSFLLTTTMEDENFFSRIFHVYKESGCWILANRNETIGHDTLNDITPALAFGLMPRSVLWTTTTSVVLVETNLSAAAKESTEHVCIRNSASDDDVSTSETTKTVQSSSKFIQEISSSTIFCLACHSRKEVEMEETSIRIIRPKSKGGSSKILSLSSRVFVFNLKNCLDNLSQRILNQCGYVMDYDLLTTRVNRKANTVDSVALALCSGAENFCQFFKLNLQLDTKAGSWKVTGVKQIPKMLESQYLHAVENMVEKLKVRIEKESYLYPALHTSGNDNVMFGKSLDRLRHPFLPIAIVLEKET